MIQQLENEKKELFEKVQDLIRKKMRLYSNEDLDSPMSEEEKELRKEIAKTFSRIDKINRTKRLISNQ